MGIININVTVTAGEVKAEKNPESADRMDTVKFVFGPDQENLRVVFKKVELSPVDVPSPSLLIHEQGPFSGPLSRSGNEISGTIASYAPTGRYLYDIHNDDNKPLRWQPPLDPGHNFGGLDVPKPPPR